MKKINLSAKLASFSEHWSPRIIGELNGQHLKLAKLQGEFEWHRHADEDELFLVLDGAFDLHLRDRVVHLEEGELFIVPRGVEHKPVADQEASVLLFEPVATRNTGDQVSARTIETADLEHL